MKFCSKPRPHPTEKFMWKQSKCSETATPPCKKSFNMFVNSSMSEMVNVGGSARPKPNEEGAPPLEEDIIISSSPASPVSVTSGEVPNHNPVTPMPLLPQLLFTNTHSQAGPPSTPATPPPLQLATPTSLSRVHKRLKLSSAPPSPVHPKHTQPPPRQMPGPPHRQQIARVITDPGAPPGCAEHSLNILGGHYLLLDHLEGSHLQRCIDVNTKQEYVCKVSWSWIDFIMGLTLDVWNLIKL